MKPFIMENQNGLLLKVIPAQEPGLFRFEVLADKLAYSDYTTISKTILGREWEISLERDDHLEILLIEEFLRGLPRDFWV